MPQAGQNGAPGDAAQDAAANAGTGTEGGSAPQDKGANTGGQQDDDRLWRAGRAAGRKAAAKEYADKVSALEAQLAALKGGKPAGDGAAQETEAERRARKTAEDAEAKASAAGTKLSAYERRLTRAETMAAAAGSQDPELVAELASRSLRVNDEGEVEVVDADGDPRRKGGKLMSVEDLVAEIYAAKPYLAPAAGARKGTDFKGAKSEQPQGIDERIAAAQKAGNLTLYLDLVVRKAQGEK